MAFKVILNNFLLKNNPIGLNNLTFQFERDNNIFGLYVVGSANLTFIGDGYCILKEIAESSSQCETPIEIKYSCNGENRTIFTGIINLGTINLDYKKGEASVSIEDNSPLALISQNSNVEFDFDSTRDIFGVERFTPSYVPVDMFDELGDYTTEYEDVPMISIKTCFEKLITFMTGKECEFESEFFSNEGTFEHYRVQFSGAPVVSQETTVRYTNFYGQEVEFVLPFAISVTFYLGIIGLAFTDNNFNNPVTANVVRDNLRQFFQHGMNYYIIDDTTYTVDIYTNVPFNDISVITTSTGGPTVTVEKIDTLVDSAFNPYFLNYNMLKKIDTTIGPYKFQMSFRELMENINALTNCFFTITADPIESNKLLIKLESERFFLSQTPTITIENVENLKADFLAENIYNEITVGSKQSQDSTINNSNVLTSMFCGVDASFGASSDFVIDPVQIFIDLASSDTETNKTDKYIVQVNNSNDQAKQFDLSAGTPIFKTYNIQLNNNTTLYRHFSKFRNNLAGSPDISINNDSDYRLFTKFEFNKTINMATFNQLLSSANERIRFKTEEMSGYYNGIIKRIDYRFLTGEALITIIGATEDF